MPTRRRQKTVRLTAAQAVVRYLQAQYSERDGERQRLIPAMFGIFGHGNVAGLGQALEEYGVGLPYYQPFHEQSMVHTACGYARTVRRMATLACTASIGPGSTNMVTGAAMASVNRLPVLLFPSDYYATRHQGPVLQQLEHPVSADVSVNDCFRPVSRFFDRIIRPEQLLTALPQAMRVLTDPAETGAVTIAMPQDVQPESYDYPAEFFENRTWHIERRPPERAAVQAAAQLLKKARRPLLIAGGGVRYSTSEAALIRLSDEFGIPVVETYSAKGIIPDSELHLGGIGICGTEIAAQIAREADLVIAVGTRLIDTVTGSQSIFQHPDVRFLSINVCGHDAFKQGSLPVTADAREGLTQLLRAARSADVAPRRSYVSEVTSLRESWLQKIDRTVRRKRPVPAMSQGQLALIIDEETQPGDTVIAAAGTQLAAAHQLAVSQQGVDYHLEFGYSCMTHELPAGLGVRLARPQGEVILYVGDGGYLMNPTELVTAAQEGLKVTLVIAENHGFQSIRGLQQARAGHAFGNEFRKRIKGTNRLDGDYVDVDLAQNAQSFGAKTWRVGAPDELRKALREARSVKQSCVIVVDVNPDSALADAGVWWDIPVAETSSDPVTRKLAAADRSKKAKQRFYY